MFHMYVGVRAGGGIGDELEDPAGDPYELYRILFDITFFFFVIVILLAIIQGAWNYFSLSAFKLKTTQVFVFFSCSSNRELHLSSGLIIDAFGELRDQQEQVKEDMEVRLCSSQAVCCQLYCCFSKWQYSLPALCELRSMNTGSNLFASIAL